MKKILNYLLLLSFVLTNLVPLTGIMIHKMAAAVFLLLCIVHTVIYRKKMGGKKFVILGIVLLAFLSGLFGMILDQYPIIMALHKVISIASVFVLAIHLFVYHRRMK